MIVGQTKPIDVYWSTPNGRKITVMLEELAVPYSVRFVDLDTANSERRIRRDLAQSPDPAIVDPEGPGGAPISILESGILLYLLDGNSARCTRRTTSGMEDQAPG